jgi:type III secretory pathway component EscV
VNGLPNATLLKLNLNSAYYDLSVNSKYQAWYPKGATLNPVLNQTVADGFMMYKFSGWQNSTGATLNAPLTVNAPQTFVASYASEMSLPPIPGFPIEAILLGMLLGILVMAFMRRKREQPMKHAEA